MASQLKIWLIYSREHNMFRRPNSAGYTPNVSEAGRYTRKDAFASFDMSNRQPDGGPSEIIVIAPDALDAVGYVAQKQGRVAAKAEAAKQFDRIATVIESVDNRCMAADGPVTPTLQEMTQEEISEIYEIAMSMREAPTDPIEATSSDTAKERAANRVMERAGVVDPRETAKRQGPHRHLKLVRDRMPARKGQLIVAVDRDVGNALLAEKILEELGEIVGSGWQDPAEYADLLEVLMETARRHGVSWPRVEFERESKRAERGGFMADMALVNPKTDRREPGDADE